MQRYDAVIIGAGPAGLEAAINLRIREKSFLLFDTDGMSEKIRVAPKVDNYLGLPGVSGEALQEHFRQHLEAMDITIRPEKVKLVFPMGKFFSLSAGKEMFEASTLILATGAYQAKQLPGEDQFLGKGLGYCATCDAPLYRGKTAVILGYTREAVHDANFMAKMAAKTYYLPMKDVGILPDAPVEVLSGEFNGIVGEGKVSAVRIGGRQIATDGVFIIRESVAPASLVRGLKIEDGYVKVDADMRTNLPGCFAAGDCTGKPHQYMRAAGQGQTAALNAVAYLDEMNQ